MIFVRFQYSLVTCRCYTTFVVVSFFQSAKAVVVVISGAARWVGDACYANQWLVGVGSNKGVAQVAVGMQGLQTAGIWATAAAQTAD